MLKSHEVKMMLALTQNNRFAGATQESSDLQGSYYCSHCAESLNLSHFKRHRQSHGLPIQSFKRQNIVHWSSASSRAYETKNG